MLERVREGENMIDKPMQLAIEKHADELVTTFLGRKMINSRLKLWYMDELGLTNPKDYLSESQTDRLMESIAILNEQLNLCSLDQMDKELSDRIHTNMLKTLQSLKIEAAAIGVKAEATKSVASVLGKGLSKLSKSLDEAIT